MGEQWDVVILCGDGDAEDTAWGAGSTREEATERAVQAARELIAIDGEADGGMIDAVAYRGAVWREVTGKCWDVEIASSDERIMFTVRIWPDRWEVTRG